MSESNFEWNEAKNQENLQKHGVTFPSMKHNMHFLIKIVSLLKTPLIARKKSVIIVLG